jgi:zinc/manganese transport system substrate-binding protein
MMSRSLGGRLAHAACLASVLLFGATAPALAQIDVVASFSILGDMTRRVAGDRARVTVLVGPDADAHGYQPTPSDAQAVARARLVVVNGLGFEGWLDRLVRASGYRGKVAVAATGITTRAMEADHDHDGHGSGRKQREVLRPKQVADPHAWQDLANGRRYVANIAAALSEADPAGAAEYRRRAEAYQGEIERLDAQARREIGAIPQGRRKIITAHDAFGYFARAYGVAILAPVGISTESEPSAGAVARLIEQMRRESIKVVFVENMTDPRLVQQIAREAGGRLGGTLYADALSKPGGPADSYLAMFRHNLGLMTAAMKAN